jgi:hypothetical protein
MATPLTPAHTANAMAWCRLMAPAGSGLRCVRFMSESLRTSMI